ncbi:MAG: amino acid ABC transporter permease/ATP-binding protein [Acidimicrobiales bacterium]
MSEFLHYLTYGFLWQGLKVAIEIAAASFAFAVPFAVLLALMRLSTKRWIRLLPSPFIWIMRGSPLLLQLVFWYDVLPQVGVHVSANVTAIIALGLNEIAFSGEIIKGGIGAVRNSQREAGMALGMSRWGILRRIVLPQALRSIAPSMANEAIVLIKNTSLASVIAVDELTLRSQQIVAANFQYAPVFVASAALYLLATSVVVVVQAFLERRLNVEGRVVKAVQPVGQRLPEHRLAAEFLSRFLGRLRRQAPETESNQGDGGVPAQVIAPSSDNAAGQVEEGRSLVRQLTRQEMPGVDCKKTPFVDIRDVHKAFHGTTVLNGVSLTVNKGDVVVILGPSGSGKTTLLRTINHLETVDKGEILVDGQLVGYRRTATDGVIAMRNPAKSRSLARIGYVFQHFNLFDHMTVLDNITEAPIRVYHREPNEARNDARVLLAWAGLSGHEDHYPHQLSGGQQQRIAIARTLACRPRLMLFDEPTSALDPELVGQVLRLIRELAEDGMTMVVVSHEVEFARACADRVIFMEGGKVVEEGTPDQMFQDPRDERTRRFLQMIDER